MEGLIGEERRRALADHDRQDVQGVGAARRDRVRKRHLGYPPLRLPVPGRHPRGACSWVEHAEVCLLIVMSVREDSEEELLAVESSCRKRIPSAGVFWDLKRRGFDEPKLVVADGALRTSAALRDVYPGAGEQRCSLPHPRGDAASTVCPSGCATVQARGCRRGSSEGGEPQGRPGGARSVPQGSVCGAKYPRRYEKRPQLRTASADYTTIPAVRWRHLQRQTRSRAR